MASVRRRSCALAPPGWPLPKAKAPVAPKAKVVAPKKTKAPVEKKVAAAKKGGSAATLAKLKEVGKKFKKDQHLAEVEALTEEVPATTFSLDGDWDSIEGLDLSKLL